MIIYLLKTALSMGILLLFYHIILEKESMYRFNRFYLLGAIIFSLMVPFIVSPFQWQLPEKPKEIIGLGIENIETESLFSNESSPQIIAKHPVITKSNSWFQENWIIMIYSLITSILMIRLVTQLMNFRRLIKCHPMVHQSNIHIVLLEKKSLPFTFFNYLFVSAKTYHTLGIEPEIWKHELTHIKERHSYDILLVELIKVIFWFNPLIYFYKKAIQLNHEFLADRAVTTSFINIPKYQKMLIDKTRVNQAVFCMSSPINYTVTKKRLQMMYKKTSLGKSTLLQVSLLPIIFLMTGFLGTVAHQHSDPSITTSLPENGSLTTQYENYINEAINVQKPNILLLEKLNIDGIKSVYQQMTAEEKEAVSYFPFLEGEETLASLKLLQGLPNPYAVEFVFSSPPAKKSISLEVWSAWKEVPSIEVEIDGTKYPREKLDEFSPTDFSLYTAREEKDRVKGTVLQVTLSTHDYYYQQHVKVAKKVIGIRASYLDSPSLEIPYGMIMFTIKNGMFEESRPENLPLSILDELINPGKKRKNIMNLKEDQGFSINVKQGNESKTQFVITN